MKRFLLGTIGTLGLLGQPALASDPEPLNLPKMPFAASAPSTPAAEVEYGHWPEDGKESCKEGCKEDKKRRWTLYGGGEALYLRPYFSSNPAFTATTLTATSDGTTTTGITTLNNTQDLDYNFDVSQRYWVGVRNECGLGIRARWFHVDVDADPRLNVNSASGSSDATQSFSFGVTPLIGGTNAANGVPGAPGGFSSNTVGGVTSPTGTGQLLSVSGSLLIDSYDGEITSTWNCGRWEITAAAGGRYTYLEQTFVAVAPGAVATTTVDGVVTSNILTEQALTAKQSFYGAGPTLALDLLRKVGDSNFSLYAAGRGSILFGRGRQQVTSSASRLFDSLDGMAPAPINFVTVSNEEGFDTLSIAEIDLGVQWGRKMGNVEVFLRPAVVGQYYFEGGSSSSRIGDFGLFGGSLGAGIRY